MRHISREIVYPSTSSEIEIIPIGDIHLGHRNCDEALLHRAVDHIRSHDNCYWIGMGDMTECIARRDPRHLESNYAEWLWGEDLVFKAQRERLAEALLPIGDKCLAYLSGNHEHHVKARLGVDMYHTPVEAIAPDTGIALGVHGFVTLKLRRKSGGHDVKNFHIYAHHGYGGGRLAGGKALKLERLPGSYDAHLYLMGHLHSLQVVPGMRLYPPNKGGQIKHREWRAVMTGAFLRTCVEGQEMYAEQAGYKPLAVGYPTITIRPYTLETRVAV